jgi:peroxisomal membrane protein 4
MYLFSRVIHGLASVLWNKFNSNIQLVNPIQQSLWFKWEAAVVWGLVMWLFYNHRKSLQESLQASMQYLYIDSDGVFENWSRFLFTQS